MTLVVVLVAWLSVATLPLLADMISFDSCFAHHQENVLSAVTTSPLEAVEQKSGDNPDNLRLVLERALSVYKELAARTVSSVSIILERTQTSGHMPLPFWLLYGEILC